MAETTNISWCDHTWSPWYGCTQVSMGPQGACEGCYARQMSEHRFHRVVFGGSGRGEGTREVRADSAWKEPLKWNREAPGSSVFPSMCDPFDNHPTLGEPRRRFFDLIRATPNLTWLLLTKRIGNVEKMVETIGGWPHNAWLGQTIVTQPEADRDIPKGLAVKQHLNIPVLFLSMEPLLGAVNIEPWLAPDATCQGCDSPGCERTDIPLEEQCPRNKAIYDYPEGPPDEHGVPSWIAQVPRTLDWVITGGETDQGKHKARPSHPDWFRSLRDQCAAAGVPFHLKQWGEYEPNETGHPITGRPTARSSTTFVSAKFTDGTLLNKVGHKAAGRILDGVIHDARPEVRA